jgi:outer membrane receptor protein involved in Fe transport
MRKLSGYILLASFLFFIASNSFAQTPQTIVSGSVKNNKTKDAVSAVSVTIKGTTTGSFTDDNGVFKFSTVQKPPFKLVVSSVGYASKEIDFAGKDLSVNIEPSYSLGDEVVVAASRVPERILESPVSIERVSAATIRNTPAASYYEILKNVKGVDVTTSSLTFNSVSTRGFNGSGNVRLNQLVDGMDNQAPGLNFSVGNVVGLTELDVESMELLAGASSALYGSGGMNGTLIINSKNPFKYQGLSFQIKQGVNHIDSYQRPIAPYYDWSVRWANKVSDRFAFKINAQFIQAKDWLANNKSNYNRTTNTVINGSRSTDPNYDGINVYGDETTQSLAGIAASVRGGIAAAGGGAGIAAIDNIIFANPAMTLAQLQAVVGATPPLAGLASYIPILYASNSSKNLYGTQAVSRTGYDEKDVVDPTTVNVKLSGGMYYKLTDNIEASLTANWGTGNTVYTGSDRYSLKNLKMGQYKLELKSKNWFLRGYTIQENSGDSYNATIAARYFNEAWMPSTKWYPTYATVYSQAVYAGLPSDQAHLLARQTADANRPTGPIYNSPLFQSIVQTPISKGGALFLDRSSLWAFEGQYNLTEALGLNKTGTELLVGGNLRKYILNSQGTLFADTLSRININETGLYAQLSQKFFHDVLKLSVSGRYDKNVNFDGRFTPRASAVLKLAKDHNLRFSYQEAYRFPTTQNQWINLLVGGGTRLMGGLPQLRNYYNFGTNPAYTLNSFLTFAATGNPALLQQQNFGNFKPENSSSYEVGYKGLIAKKLLIDVYAYWAKYQNYLGSVTCVQSNTGSIAGLASSSTRTIYSISVNSTDDIKTNGWGASVEYLLPGNFNLNANVYQDQVSDAPVGFITYFNTPKTRFNLGFSNSGFLYNNRIGFGITYRWQDAFTYEGSFAIGTVPSYGTVDGMVSYKLPQIKSLIKLGATNLFNHYYYNGFGNAQIGGLYYISFGYNVF